MPPVRGADDPGGTDDENANVAVAAAGYAGLLSGPPFVGAIATWQSLRMGVAALAATACAAAVISVATACSE